MNIKTEEDVEQKWKFLRDNAQEEVNKAFMDRLEYPNNKKYRDIWKNKVQYRDEIDNLYWEDIYYIRTGQY